MKIILHDVKEREERERVISILSKLTTFEMQIILEEYERMNDQLRVQLYDIVKSEVKQKISASSEDLADLTDVTSSSIEQVEE